MQKSEQQQDSSDRPESPRSRSGREERTTDSTSKDGSLPITHDSEKKSIQLSGSKVPESKLDQAIVATSEPLTAESLTAFPEPCAICTGACHVQIEGWPEHMRTQIRETFHSAISIADASSDQTLCAWVKNLKLATLATDDVESEQNDKEVGADALLMSSETFARRQACGDTFKKPVVIRESFADSGKYALDAYGDRLKQCIGETSIDVQGDDGPEIADVSKFIDQLWEGQPCNALSLPDLARAIEPELVRTKRFQMLSNLTFRASARSRQSTAKPVRYCDIDSCQNFNILGGRGAFSGAHVDALNGTWLRNLFGTKLWFIIPTESMHSEDWDCFGQDGALWDPGDKARAIPLGPDDVLLLPPGLCVIHAVLTTSPCLMQGGMIWDDKCLPSILQNLFWIGRHQRATNEAMPYQISAILEELEDFIHVNGCFPTEEKNAIASGISKLRSLGCQCRRGRCSQNCLCLTEERRCTPLCAYHAPKTELEWECMIEQPSAG